MRTAEENTTYQSMLDLANLHGELMGLEGEGGDVSQGEEHQTLVDTNDSQTNNSTIVFVPSNLYTYTHTYIHT